MYSLQRFRSFCFIEFTLDQVLTFINEFYGVFVSDQ